MGSLLNVRSHFFLLPAIKDNEFRTANKRIECARTECLKNEHVQIPNDVSASSHTSSVCTFHNRNK